MATKKVAKVPPITVQLEDSEDGNHWFAYYPEGGSPDFSEQTLRANLEPESSLSYIEFDLPDGERCKPKLVKNTLSRKLGLRRYWVGWAG